MLSVDDYAVRQEPRAVGVGPCHNQYLVNADEPLLFHAGLRALFPSVFDQPYYAAFHHRQIIVYF